MAADPIAAKGYSTPDKLVSTEWLAAHLSDPTLRVIESDEDVLLYDTGHIQGAQKVDWHADLNDDLVRDYVDRERFERLLRAKGIDDSTTVIFYGDKNNWWACYALWVFELFGFKNGKVLDGGRMKWELEGREFLTEVPKYAATAYEAPPRNDARIRAFRDEVLAHAKAGKPLVDVRSPDEFTGRGRTWPSIRRRACCAADTFPARRACRGRAPRTRMAPSRVRPSCARSTRKRKG